VAPSSGVIAGRDAVGRFPESGPVPFSQSGVDDDQRDAEFLPALCAGVWSNRVETVLVCKGSFYKTADIKKAGLIQPAFSVLAVNVGVKPEGG